VDVDREVTARLEREHYDPEARSGHQRSGRCQGRGGAAVHGAYTGTGRSLHSSTRHPKTSMCAPSTAGAAQQEDRRFTPSLHHVRSRTAWKNAG
jgi:hypothetical protein